MTPEQLASEELAEWREKTIKKELEMITEVAKVELQMSSGSVRKMTYKGEIEIERNTGLVSYLVVMFCNYKLHSQWSTLLSIMMKSVQRLVK